jgi:hypothetical protein
LTPGWVKIKIRIRDKDPGSYFRELRNNFWVKMLKFFDADPGGIRNLLTLDPGWKKCGINIPDPQHWNKAAASQIAPGEASSPPDRTSISLKHKKFCYWLYLVFPRLHFD